MLKCNLIVYDSILNKLYCILTLSLIGIVLTGSLISSHADVQSPRKQIEQGILPENVMCREGRVLAVRDNGNVSCVYQDTAEKLNWKVIQDIHSKIVDSNMPPVNNNDTYADSKFTILGDKKISITNIGKESDDTVQGELGSYDRFWPQHTLTFPEQVRIGEPFDVVLDYRFIVPTIDDDEFGVEFEVYEEPESACSVEICGDYKIWISRPSNVDLLNRTDYIFDNAGTDTRYVPHRSGETGYVHPPYNNTHPQQETFTLVINKPTIDYNYGEIEIAYLQQDNEYIYFYVAPNNVAHLSEDPVYMPNEGPSQLVEDFSYLVEKNATNTTYTEPPPEYIHDLAKFLKEYYPNTTYTEQEFLDDNFSKNFIEKFFEAYPELRIQSSTSSLHWILPQAYGAPPSFSSVSGNLKHYDPDGNKVALEDVKICAFDTERGKLTKLYNGRTHVCVTSGNNGYFRLVVPTADPNGSGGTDLILKAYSENDNFAVYENNNRDVHTITDTSVKYDLSSSRYSYGDFTLPKTQNSAKAFWVIDELESIRDWYVRDLGYLPPKSYVVWDPQRCLGAGVDPASKEMSLEHVYKITSNGNKSCPNSVISPLSNADTLSHEYAHMQFYRQYDSKNSNYPTYDLRVHDRQLIHSPVHDSPSATTWIEGWAFFMATAYSDSPVFQPAYMKGQWNFETRSNTETKDPRFAGKSFVSGIEGEGNVAAALYDAIDTTNENTLDDQSGQLRNIWNTMRDNKERGESVIASDFMEFKNDWDDSSRPSLDNIFKLNTLPASQSSNCDPTSSGYVFSDNFDCDISQWVLSGGELNWHVVKPEERQRPNVSNDNTVANADNCDSDCNLETKKSINLSGYTSATLSFWRYVDRSVDNDEGLRAEISTDNGNVWTEIGRWTDTTGHDNDRWTLESISLNNYLSSNVKIRFVALSSSSSEEVEVDDVKISGR